MNIKFNLGNVKLNGRVAVSERHDVLRHPDGTETLLRKEVETVPLDVEVSNAGFEIEDISIKEIAEAVPTLLSSFVTECVRGEKADRKAKRKEEEYLAKREERIHEVQKESARKRKQESRINR